MAGFLSALASAFARFLQRESRRTRFARRRILRRHGAGFRRYGRGAGFRRHGNGSGLHHRSGLGGRRRHFVLNRRRHGGRHHSVPRQTPVPATGQGAQNIAADVAGPSAPPPPAFAIPPMDWLLGGPASSFLGEEEDFEATLVPLPPGILFGNGTDAGVAFCPEHGYGPCPARKGYEASPPPPATPTPETDVVDDPDAYLDLPTPTPSDKDPEHFMLPVYGPVPELYSPPPAEETSAHSTAAPFAFDLNVQVDPEDEEAFVAAPSRLPGGSSDKEERDGSSSRRP